MKGLFVELAQDGVTEHSLEEQATPHITVCCDVCSPFSETLKKSVQSTAHRLVREALNEEETSLTEDSLLRALHRANERLRSHFKRDRKRLALSLVVFVETQEEVFVASSGDLLVLKAHDEGLEILNQAIDASKFSNEREHLKELSDAFIRSPSPRIKINSIPTDNFKGMASFPQALYHRLSPEEVRSLLKNPYEPTSNLEKLLGKNQIVLSNLELAIMTAPQGHFVPKKLHVEKEPITHFEPKTEEPMPYPSKPSLSRLPYTKYILGAAAAALVVGGGIGIYQSNKSPKQENSLAQSETSPAAEEELSTNEDLAEDAETFNALHRRLEAQREIITKLENSLAEESQKNALLEKSLSTESQLRISAEKGLASATEEQESLSEKLTKAQEAKKAVKLFNLKQIAGTNPYLTSPEEPFSPFPKKEWDALSETKENLEKKLADLAIRHDDLVAENALLQEQIEILNDQENPESSTLYKIAKDRAEAIKSLERKNQELKQALTNANAAQEKSYNETTYYQEAYAGLQKELRRQRERNTLLLSEIEAQKRSFQALMQDTSARSSSPVPIFETTPRVIPERIAKQEVAPTMPTAPKETVHIVQKGETLSEISVLYYGSSKEWKKILEANKEKVGSSNLIKVGMELTIPAPKL